MFVQKRTTIGAGAVNNNVLSGDQYEFAPLRSIVEFGILGTATGLVADILIGSRAIVTDLPVSIVSVANRFAIYPDDFTIKGGALPSERIIVRVRNPTGGSIDALTTVKYNPA